MRPFLYRLTLAAALGLSLPAPVHAAVWGSPPEPEPQKSAKELAAEKEAEQTSMYFIASIAAIVALLVVVQFMREMRASGPAPRLVVYHSGGGLSHDGLGSPGSSYGGLGRSAHGLGDSQDDPAYPSRYDSDF